LQIVLSVTPALLAMIVCSCNVLSDHDVRATLAAGEAAPRTTGQVYHCLGCSVRCGRCARTIRRIMDEALAVADAACAADPPCS
jgi:bacterioferritin-associated ferredoxin